MARPVVRIPTYDEFCRVYGRDIREWPGYRVLRDVRELRMIATNAASPALAHSGQLQRGEFGEPWAIL